MTSGYERALRPWLATTSAPDQRVLILLELLRRARPFPDGAARDTPESHSPRPGGECRATRFPLPYPILTTRTLSVPDVCRECNVCAERSALDWADEESPLRAEPDGLAPRRQRASAVANRRLGEHGCCCGSTTPTRARNVPGGEEAILADLEWLGLAWDEGPVRQSERAERHREAARGSARPLRRRHARCARTARRRTTSRQRRRRHRLRDHARRPRQRPPAERGAPPAAARGARRDAARVRPPRPDPRRRTGGSSRSVRRARRSRAARGRASRRRPSARTSRSSGLPRHDVHYDLPRIRRLAIEAIGAMTRRRARGASRRPGRAGAGAARRARPERGARLRDAILEPEPAPLRRRRADARAVPRAASSARTAARRGAALVRELKAVGGDLRALRLALTGARPRARALGRDRRAPARGGARARDRCGSTARSLAALEELPRAARPGPDVLLRPDRLPAGPRRQRAAVRDLHVARALAPRARLRRRRSSTTSPTSTTRSTRPRPGGAPSSPRARRAWYLEDTGDFGLGLPDHDAEGHRDDAARSSR